LIFGLDARDYESSSTTWPPRVGTHVVTFSDVSKVTKVSNGVHLAGTSENSNFKPFLNGLADFTWECLIKAKNTAAFKGCFFIWLLFSYRKKAYEREKRLNQVITDQNKVLSEFSQK
jgi:hypothetical protein